MKLVWAAAALVIGVGVVLAARDYKQWKYEETKNFGHGPGQVVVKAVLANLYENDIAGIRFKYDHSWEVSESEKFRMANYKTPVSFDDIAGVGERVSIVRLAKVFDVQIERLAAAQTSLSDLADREAADLTKKGMVLTREREYLNTDRVSETILTWNQEGVMHQRAMAVKGDRLVIIDSVADEATFRDLAGSLVIF